MRILYLNPLGTMGGAETSLLNLMGFLRTNRPDWKLSLIASSDGPLLAHAGDLGVGTRVIPFPRSLESLGDSGAGRAAGPKISKAAFMAGLCSAGTAAPSYLKRLRDAVCDFNPDIVHSNGFKMHLFSGCALPSRIPLLWHIHDYVRSRPLAAHLLRLCAPRCSTAVANSSSVAEDVRSLCRKRLKVEAVHNGIDTKLFSPEGPRLDLDDLAHLRAPQKPIVRVGLVGTFARWKGHETFLRALALLDPGASIRGYIVGGPIYQTRGSQYHLAELQALACALGLSGRVGFTGFVGNPADAMRSLDIVVHASTEPEPFGLVIVEAMACGKAVIVSNCGGVPEIVQDGLNAAVHAPGNAEMLAERIQTLAAAPELRVRMGTAARKTVEDRFNQTKFASEFVRIYQQLADTN